MSIQSLDQTAGELLELSQAMTGMHSLRDHLARTIADSAVSGDTNSEDFRSNVTLYEQTSAELAEAQTKFRTLSRESRV